MFVFHYNTFLGNLHLQAPTNRNIPVNSPIFLFFNQEGDLTKHEMLRKFNNLLGKNSINWIRPLREITSEWLIDLKELKTSFEILSKTKYLKGKLTIEPEYLQRKQTEEITGEIISVHTSLKFSVYPDEIQSSSILSGMIIRDELVEPLRRFHADYKNSEKCGFLMMKYEDTSIQTEIERIVKEHFRSIDFNILRADDKWYSDDLLTNIKTYMHGCYFGIALFERINTNYFNPNVSLEIGYMMSLNKPILYLKDKTLVSLQTDLVGKLYSEFDFQKPKDTLPKVIDKWLKDNEMM